MGRTRDLLATCWTTAGDVVPGRTGEVSPFPLEERVAAAAKAGYRGFGLAASDVAATRVFDAAVRVFEVARAA